MNLETLTTFAGLVTGVVGVLKGVKWIIDGLEGRVKKLVEDEVATLAQRVINLQSIVIDLRKKNEDIAKEQNEIRSQMVSHRILLGEVAAEFRAGQKEQMAAIARIEKSSVEWITEEIARIKGVGSRK